MRKVILAAVAAVVSGGCGGAPEPREFEAGNFRVAIPGKVETREQTLQTPAGPMTANMVVSQGKGGDAYNVTYTALPLQVMQSGDPQTLIDTFVGGLVQSGQWTVLDQHPTTLDGHPGREVRLENQPPGASEKLTGWLRVFIVGDRLYQVMTLGPLSKMKPEPAVAFLDSFALLSPVKPVFPSPGQVLPSTPAPPQPPPSGLATNTPPPTPPPAVTPAPTPPPATPAPTPDAGPRPTEAGTTGGTGASAGGASIVAFRWIDGDQDVVGGHGGHGQPDGTKDQHFKLELDLPPDTTVEEMTLTQGGFNKFVTRPDPHLWSIGIFQGKKAVALDQVERIGRFSGKQEFDLFANTGIGLDSPGALYDLQVVVNVQGRAYTLTAWCKKPDPNNPDLPSSEAGVSIDGFRWMDEAEDHVGGFGDAGRPDGQNDQHFRVELDLPPDSTIEEMTLTGPGNSKWVTYPSDEFWPLAVSQGGKALVTADAPEVGKFTGKQAFDLFANSNGRHEPGTPFDLQVTVFSGGERHLLGTHCRKP